MIKTFNKAVSNVINKAGETYEVLIGTENCIPEPVIEVSSDFNCGALCNELEFLRRVSDYFVRSLDLDDAEDDNLNTLITTFLDLPRRGKGESDRTYKNRYKALVIQQGNSRRTTKGAIIDALKHILDTAKIQIIEKFNSQNLYFQLRLVGSQNFDGVIFMDNLQQAYIGQGVIGGDGVGSAVSYIPEVVARLKALGVSFDIMFISQKQFIKTMDAVIV